jgi:hypothetical protein
LLQVWRAWSLCQRMPEEEPSTHTSAEPADAADEERESDPADQQGTAELRRRQGDAR